ncbi:MAG: hypothetical protein NZ898_03715 [Myxococcota bacterium]|nr:hypothetical protein [Myxococcota bacterium]MDW8361216.1 hypothetical protein [Myxococcales bacterium]
MPPRAARRRGSWVPIAAIATIACGDDGPSGPSDGGLVNGCPTHPHPLAAPGDSIDGHDYVSFAAPFFARYCTRCHGSDVHGDDRLGAPPSILLDVEAVVRSADVLRRIRETVAVTNFMPDVNRTPPEGFPTCEERRLLARWIDAGAP